MYLSGDIILHKCTKNHDHMLYCSWNMACDEYNCYFSFWAIFCPFSPITVQKFKISKKRKNAWRYHHFAQVYEKSWSYGILFLRYDVWCMQLLFFILGYFLPFYPEKWKFAWKMKICLKNFLEKQKFQKTEKNAWRYHHFTQVYQKKWSYAILFLRYGVRLL